MQLLRMNEKVHFNRGHSNPDTESVILLDNSEDSLWQCQERLRRDFPEQKDDYKLVLGDIRDPVAVRDAMLGGPGKPYLGEADAVIHTAALKHVLFTNDSPEECIGTNIEGTQNLLRTSMSLGVPVFVNISSDKACYPATIYGLSKKAGELLTTWASGQKRYTTEPFDNAYFSCRFGNFLPSRGSVFERWEQQRKSGSIMLTDPLMNRFFIKPSEAARFVINGIDGTESEWGCGTVHIPMMKVISMETLAELYAEKYGVGVEVMGMEKGEKYDELLIGYDEANRAVMESNGIVVYPGKQPNAVCDAISTAQLPLLSKEQTREYVRDVF